MWTALCHAGAASWADLNKKKIIKCLFKHQCPSSCRDAGRFSGSPAPPVLESTYTASSLVLLLHQCWNPPIQQALLFSCSVDVGIHPYSKLSCSPALVMLKSTHTVCSLALLLCHCWNPPIQHALLFSCSVDDGIHPKCAEPDSSAMRHSLQNHRHAVCKNHMVSSNT